MWQTGGPVRRHDPPVRLRISPQLRYQYPLRLVAARVIAVLLFCHPSLTCGPLSLADCTAQGAESGKLLYEIGRLSAAVIRAMFATPDPRCSAGLNNRTNIAAGCGCGTVGHLLNQTTGKSDTHVMP